MSRPTTGAAEALDKYVEAAELEEPKATLFQSVDPAGRRLTGRALQRRVVLAMSQAAGGRSGAAPLDVLPHVPGDGDHGVSVKRGTLMKTSKTTTELSASRTRPLLFFKGFLSGTAL